MKTIVGQDIGVARSYLEAGELVCIPTETVYGLAANGLDPFAISKIYQVKNRPSFNPLILHLGRKEEISKYSLEIPNKLIPIIDQWMPGPVTILLNKSEFVPDIVTAGSSKVALRIPNHSTTLSLLNSLDFPLCAPSANPSGYVSPTSAKHCLDGLGDKIPYILDGGETTLGVESTIIGYDDNLKKIVIHRYGGLSIEMIQDTILDKVIEHIHHDRPETPGQLKSHYATNTPLICGDILDIYKIYSDKNVVFINLFEKKDIDVYRQYVLSKNSSLEEVANQLFKVLREADNIGADYLFCEYADEIGLGKAINDRLRRAQYKLK